MNSVDLIIKDFITNVTKPAQSFGFPKTNGRSFRFDWLQSFPWLCYSRSEDGAFCISCVLFGDKFPSKINKIKKLFSQPFSHWPDGNPAFKRHQESQRCGLHSYTYPIYIALLSNITGKTLPINVLVDTNLRKRIAENRKKLAPIVDTVYLLFCL